MLAARRRARYGYLLALPVLFCSRSSVYRIVRLYRTGTLGYTVDPDGQLAAPVRTSVLPEQRALQRSSSCQTTAQ
jgi:hypothetical protein